VARRREYVSFFDSPRRKRGETLFADRRRGLSPRLVGVSLVIGLVAASVWWFVIRDTGDTPSAEGRILGDTTVPTLLLPSGGTSLPETGVSLIDTACAAQGSTGNWQTFQGSNAHLGCVSARTISNPEILWTFEVGIQGWLNNPIIADGTVFVGSA